MNSTVKLIIQCQRRSRDFTVCKPVSVYVTTMATF